MLEFDKKSNLLRIKMLEGKAGHLFGGGETADDEV